jgi:F subunit of K+-transporting ATPase (Potass_KdpF)
LSRPASNFDRKDRPVLYLTGALTVAALIYLTYVMIFPEKF